MPISKKSKMRRQGATLKSKSGRKNLLKAPANGGVKDNQGKTALSNTDTKTDLTTGRVLFPVDVGGKIQYLPAQSEASDFERSRGIFVSNQSIGRDSAAGQQAQRPRKSPATAVTHDPARFDFAQQRLVYGVKDENNKTVYFPKQSDASALERARGLFVPDDVVFEHEQHQRRTALGARDNQANQALRRARRADRLTASFDSFANIF
jgi:hypothetical protein